MKKRILALALAGTTAFSVFGAAVTADAYSTAGSAQVVSTNDIYKHYTPVAEKIDTNYTGATDSTVVYYRWKEDSKTYEKINGVTNDTELHDYLAKFNNIKENFSRYTKITDAKGNTYYVASADDVLNYQGGKQEGGIEAFGVTPVQPGTGDWGVANSKYSYDGKVYDSLSALIDALDGDKTEYGYKNKNSDAFRDGNAYDAMAYETIDQYAKANVITKSADDSKPGSATITITADKAGNYDWNFDASTNSDTTIYPWTVSTKYVTDKNGYKVAVDEAVSNPTVYLFDFIPANSTVAPAGDIAYYYNKGDVVTAAGLIDNNPNGSTTWTAENGRGGSYGIRREVVEEYENFLYELQLVGNDRYDYVITNPNVFKDQYKDLYVSGNYYDRYTGQVVGTWKSDVYNLEEMFDDIWNSRNTYESMNTSEMLYLMQQYDKYVGNYVDKEEVDNDAWGDLLVSILESVTEDDFTKATYYKQFSRAAEDAIDNYEDAVSSAQIRSAEQKMYDLIVFKNYKTASSDDAKAELNNSIAALYFNEKVAADEYETAGNIRTNAALTDYSYIAAVTTVADPIATTDITLTQTSTTSTGHYALYPASDYYQYGNNAAQFPGNDIRGTAVATKNVTSEYEWFLNVYELAASAAKTANVPSMMSAVSKALDEAVAALEITNTATASAQTALEEMIKNYEGKLDMYVTGNGVNKEDFAEKFYSAYEEALAYADAAEGAAQVANARRMVAVAGEALTYQGAQVTVTKNDIKTVEEAIKNGNTALKAIKEDPSYNAAQVNALNKALATANEIVAIWNGTAPTYNKVNHAVVGYIGDKDAIVKSDITGAIDAINAAINYSKVIIGWSKNEAGKWQYGTEEGYLKNGWNKIDKTWFYFNEDGTAKQSEWLNDNGTWYWFNSNCGAATGWAKVDGSWYYFKGNNAMKTGWEKVDGNWYYMASSGKMVTGWCEIGGKWYYFSKESNSLGQMLYNTTVDGYKLDANGVWVK